MKFILLCVWLSSLLDLCSLSPSSHHDSDKNCNNNVCNKNATCKMMGGKLGCYCNSGFTGDGVRHCEDDDECQNATLTCGQNATCTNTYGSYYCTCVEGYESSEHKKKFTPNDGTTCQEIPETPCHLNNECLSGRINDTLHQLVCSIVAGLLHYFFLAAFAWMCIEGIHLYLIVVGVIYNKGFLHRNFYIFGYGSPFVVVGISAILGYKYYGTDKVCWLSTENNFIWSFIGPACLIILVNLLAFGVIIYKVFRHTSMLKPEVSCYENIRSCARGAMALLFLLGATWTFGVLHIIKGSMVTAYLFTISNVFQGMFIFVFLCILSKKIQKEYYRLFKNVPCCFGCLR
ncbi:adhesion G protein-coupled receptor L4 [Rhincodon typus]|uniref:adhesion G protein-coupled receptor L4 n=1 Tax=Rhincodon typus TaxID=259920 RepID=UPI00202F35F5|nr:adhesion G protein-coupled receptor L4 [Rhincodon typus]